jgi:2-dehydropantoate 2-reductase
MKYAIIGLGGTGGYLGGLLARAGEDVCFIVRGAALRKITRDGLNVHSEINGDFVARPAHASDNPLVAAENFGLPDVLFICVKGYSLDEAIDAAEPLIGADTIVIPLLNGVGHGQHVFDRVGRGLVLDACMYVTSRSPEPGLIVHTDKYNKIVFGAAPERPATRAQQARMETIAATIRQAGMECILSPDIETAVWEKYNYNCAFSVLTARYQTNADGVRRDPTLYQMMRQISEETASVARALGIQQPDNMVARSMRILDIMLPEGTSSMKRDVEAHRACELELFSGTLCRLAEGCGQNVPVSQRLYAELKAMLRADTHRQIGPPVKRWPQDDCPA